MSSFSLLHLSLRVALVLHLGWVSATNSSSPTVVESASDIATQTTQRIEFSSAMEIEASVSVQLNQLSSIPAVPIPSNITDFPEYETIAQIATALPPLPAGIKLPGSDKIMAELIASSNDTSNTGSNLVGRQNGLRVMIVGDSMSQGQEGDYTWRYRIWQWFQKNGINVQLVGPYKGTVPPMQAKPPQPPPLFGTKIQPVPYGNNGGYAKGVDASFLSGSYHFSVWGRAAAGDQGLIKDVLSQHPADLMLLMLGFNDLGWFYSNAPGTIESIGSLVSNARAANPNLKFAIANIPQRSRIGGRDDLIENTKIYNNLLPNAIKKWTTTQSPIHLVDLAKVYDCGPDSCPAGYDGLHPNAWGEFQIANAFSKTLVNDFKMGSSPLAIPSSSDPSLARNLPVPSNFKVFSSPQGVTATWDPVYGAFNYDVKVSINGGVATANSVSQFNRWDAHWPIEGWTYDVSVRASAGDFIHSDYTGTQSAKSAPQLAPAPQNIKVHPTSDGFSVSWDPPSGPNTDSIVEYNIIYWDWEPTHCAWISGAAFKSSPATITGLKSGVNYLIALVTWNKNGEGFPAFANNVVVGAGKPSTPSGLKIDAIDAASVRITWSDNGSGGYRVWSRNVKTSGSKSSVIANVTMTTCNEEYFLFPGAWNYAFAVSSFNGNDESSPGKEVIAPSASAGGGPKCPAPKSWCPAGGTVSVPPGTNPSNPPDGGDPNGPGDATTTTSGAAIPTAIPISTNGHCAGPDCVNGKCTGPFCATMGCEGKDCISGWCFGPDCDPSGCIGASCRDGVCKGPGCSHSGCLGPQCDGHGRCSGLHCISIHCIGPQCSKDGTCSGPNCSESTCTGVNCVNGVCVGPGCRSTGGSKGGGSDAPEPEPDRPDDCTTYTYTACKTKCTYDSTTSSCSKACSNVEGCSSPTDQSTATTKTASCPDPPKVTNQWSPKDPNAQAPMLGGGGLAGAIDFLGPGVTITSLNPSQTPTKPPPPSATSTKKPETTPTKTPTTDNYLFIAREIFFGSNGNPMESQSWVTYDWTKGDDIGGVCNQNASFRKKVDKGTEGYPVGLIGPFNTHGLKGCTYKGIFPNILANLYCPDRDPIPCRESKAGELCADDTHQTVAVLECFW